MKRRTFIGSLLAGLGAVCFPWKKRKREKSLEEIKQEILTEHLRSQVGQTGLAVGLAFPLIRRVFPSRVLPSLIQVERIPDGALPFYDREP